MLLPAAWAQAPKAPKAPVPVAIEQPDAHRTREELSRLLDRYPPALKGILALDPNLLSNQAYLAPYPALVAFLNAHPEVGHNPSFYLEGFERSFRRDSSSPRQQMWSKLLDGLAVFTGFGMAIGLLVWLIRTLVDYRRWNRLTRIQTEVHTKLLDRFTANDDLLAYVQSPAGAKFLESSPIALDAAPRSLAAPLGRILWSVQAGLVLVAAGTGLLTFSREVTDEAAQPLHGMGVLGIALGLGFVISAVISFLICRRLGLIDAQSALPRSESPRLPG
jgi:hypothetical protein